MSQTSYQAALPRDILLMLSEPRLAHELSQSESYQAALPRDVYIYIIRFYRFVNNFLAAIFTMLFQSFARCGVLAT